MNQDRLSEEQIYEAAFALRSSDARLDYLKGVCRDDQQVERLLALLKEGSPQASFLERGPAAVQKMDSAAMDHPKKIGDFEILGELGRGGMGIVYRARQCSLNRPVALKVLSAGLGLTTKAIMRFKLEAEAAARLHHTNIVPIYWTGDENRVPYYAMELIDGPSLDQVIKQLRAESSSEESHRSTSGATGENQVPVHDWIKETLIYSSPAAKDPVSSTDAAKVDSSSSLGANRTYYDNVAEMMAGVADALAHAHDHGIIHRDIKPANLLLSSDGRLSINDFGLARMLEQPGMTMTGELMGSPMYMSPEQITAGRLPLDNRTDIYSLGATLYEMLTLAPPYPGQQRDQVLSQVIHKDPPRPRSIDSQIPKDLETICLKAMEKDPDRRYQTAEQLAADLRRYVNRNAISARRTGPVERAIRWARKNKALTAMACLTLLVGVAATVFGYVNSREKQQLADKKKELTGENRRLQREQALENALEKAMGGKFKEAKNYAASAVGYGADKNWIPMIESLEQIFVGNAADAVEMLEKVVAEDRKNLTAQWMLAQAYVSDGHWAGYAAKVSELKGQYPDRPEEQVFAGSALSLLHTKDSIELLREILKEKSHLVYARNTLAFAMVFQAIDTAGGDSSLADEALSQLGTAAGLRGEEDPGLASTRLYAHLTKAYLEYLHKEERDPEAAKKYLEDRARGDVVVLNGFPEYLTGNLMRLYYYQFTQDFDGMYRVMENVIEHGHGGWIADPFWKTCFMDPEWVHRDAKWKNVRIQEKALEMLDGIQQPHRSDEFVAFARLVFRLDRATTMEEVAQIHSDYFDQRADTLFDSYALLLTGQLTASRQLTDDSLEFFRKMSGNSEEKDAFHYFRLFHTEEIGETEYFDHLRRSERDLSSALFSIGLRKLSQAQVKEKRQEALKLFQEAASGTMYHWTSYNWSRAFADRMEKDKGWPHWPMLTGPKKAPQGISD